MSQAWSEIVILPSEGQAGPGLRLTVPALANEAAALSALGAFVDPVTETGAVFSSWGTVAREETLTARTVLSVGPLPGVTDPIAKTALEVLADLGLIPADAQGYAERLRVLESATGAPATLARLFNPLIERGSVTTTTALWRFVGEEPPKVRLTGEDAGLVLEVELPGR